MLWLIWLLVTIMLASWLGYAMLAERADRSVFMPGALSPGHHQLQPACASCHTDPLGGREVLQDACIKCHGDERRKPFDSHPKTKFQDPRNADRLDNIDALHCTTCHTEHQPGITAGNGLTQPRDLCFHCHRDVAEDRPSHAGMAFTSCASGGCHNFHDNRALYTKFLINHLDEPDLLDVPVVPAREFAGMLDQIIDYPLARYPQRPLGLEDADATFRVVLAHDSNPHEDWAATAHARSGVNCSACHRATAQDGSVVRWINLPDADVCGTCHGLEVERFGKGKHGMKQAAGLPPLQVSEARLPMQEDAAHERLTCNSCHAAHRYDVHYAASEACLRCHADEHTLAYKGSPHQLLWERELRGELPAGSGVSCATCHLPRVDMKASEWLTRITVDHNQGANLAPNSKMIRTTCLHCHGLAFSIDALADRSLVASNFTGRPSVHVRTMDLAAAEAERRATASGKDDDTSMFGF